MTRTAILTILLMTGPYLIGCDSDNDSKGDGDIATTLNWTDCGEAGLQCATLSVPMNYLETEADTIDMALIRHAASSVRRGVLLLNPGGPGGSGVMLLEDLITFDAFPESVLESFDLIGFDPRGIGESRPVDCTEFGLNDIDEYPIDVSAATVMHADYTSFASGCAEKYGNYLQHLGSANVVRDMDEIRKAIGDEKINFIGYSYGTRLGALYLQIYPGRSGQFVLDASLPPQSAISMLISGQLDLMQTNIKRVLSTCLKENPDCSPDGLLIQLNERIVNLISTNTFESAESIDLVGEIVISATLDLEFAELAAEPLISYIESGDLSAFLPLADFMDSPANDEDDEEDNATAEVAVMCADDAARPDATELITVLEDYNGRSDLFAEYLIPAIGMCSGWPEAIEPLPPIAVDTAPVSLVIGGTNDAQTPLQWSESMANSIGGLFITSEHSGHTSAFNGSSECINDIVEAFLVENTLPDNLYCGQE